MNSKKKSLIHFFSYYITTKKVKKESIPKIIMQENIEPEKQSLILILFLSHRAGSRPRALRARSKAPACSKNLKRSKDLPRNLRKMARKYQTRETILSCNQSLLKITNAGKMCIELS